MTQTENLKRNDDLTQQFERNRSFSFGVSMPQEDVFYNCEILNAYEEEKQFGKVLKLELSMDSDQAKPVVGHQVLFGLRTTPNSKLMMFLRHILGEDQLEDITIEKLLGVKFVAKFRKHEVDGRVYFPVWKIKLPNEDVVTIDKK